MRGVAPRTPWMVTLLLAAAATACGGGGEAAGPVEGDGAPPAPTTATIVMRDNEFDPSEVRVASQGGMILLTLVNEGSTDHTFTYEFMSGGSLGFSRNEVNPGEEEEHDDEVPAGTTIEFYCEYHREQGMTGTLLVQ
jgi:plastocyanin